MTTYNVRFRWKGQELVESVVCCSVAEAANLIRARYSEAFVIHVWEVRSSATFM